MSETPENDEQFMRQALELAVKASELGEVPVGAVAVAGGRVVGTGYNRVEQEKNPFVHAEIAAMTEAVKNRGDWRLEDVTVYVTKEPCAMCAGAMVNARVKRVVFGMPDPRSGAAGGALDITGFPGMLHQLEVRGGVLEDECRKVIQNFFKKVRSSGKK